MDARNEIKINHVPLTVELTTLTQTQQHELREKVLRSKKTLLTFIHPFFNLLTSANHPPGDQGAMKEYIQELTTLIESEQDNKEAIVEKLSETPQYLFYRSSNRSEVNENHKKYYLNLAKFFSNTKTEIIFLGEEESQLSLTTRCLRKLGYQGAIVYYETKAKNPDPASSQVSYDVIAQTMQALNVEKILLAGQNMWFSKEANDRAELDVTHPLVLQTDNQEDLSYFAGCVGIFGKSVATSMASYPEQTAVQISSLTFPQRRSRDPHPTR